MKQDSQHPIIERPFEYSIVAFYFERDFEDGRESYFDLTLRKGNVTRRLRFLAPSNIRIGDVWNNSGMVILDISARQWDGLSVEIANFENAEGSIELCARDVIDLDEEETKP